MKIKMDIQSKTKELKTNVLDQRFHSRSAATPEAVSTRTK